MTEDEIVGWHHQLDGHKFEQALEVGNGKGNLVWGPWCCKELDMIEQLKLNPIGSGFYPYDLIYLKCLLKALSPNTITLKCRASIYEFWWNTI